MKLPIKHLWLIATTSLFWRLRTIIIENQSITMFRQMHEVVISLPDLLPKLNNPCGSI